MTSQGQTKKYCIRTVLLYLFYLYMVMGLIGNIFRLISCMSSISRHVLKLFSALKKYSKEHTY